jgi:hypothetical protein
MGIEAAYFSKIQIYGVLEAIALKGVYGMNGRCTKSHAIVSVVCHEKIIPGVKSSAWREVTEESAYV